MIHLELTEKEAALLRDTLKELSSDARFEIARTDRKDYREQLKERDGSLSSIAERLSKQLDTRAA